MSDFPPNSAGRLLEPLASDDEEALPLDQLSTEPPPTVEKPSSSKASERQVPDSKVQKELESKNSDSDDSGVLDNPAFRPNSFPPLPPTEILLDPSSAPPPIPEQRPKRPPPPLLSPSMRALFATLFGLAALFSVFALLIRFRPHPTPGVVASASSPSVRIAHTAPASSASVQPPAVPLPNLDDEPGIPSPWRISDLKNDETVRIIEGQVGLDPLVDTLDKKHVSKKETYRVIAAFKSLKVLDRPNKHSKFVVAVDKATSRVKAFELELNSSEIYQAKENEEGLLSAARLDLKIASRRTVTSFRITDDLPTDLRRGRLRESAIEVINSAFDGRANLHSMPKGSTVRVVMQEQTALGRFASYEFVEAIEYQSSKDGAEPLRIYRFKDGSHWGNFDQKAREPFRGGWRRPCPSAPITSNFNPKRLHPVLHIVKPHLGTDFGAPTGTPIHATSYGVVGFMGPAGPAGNLIIIKHPGDIDSYYMHQSRFAPGLHKGDKVETFQVIGYVGTTGRSTGPHLHFGIKKAGTWIDAMSLKLDGSRTVSALLRADFNKLKGELDAVLDGIPLPESTGDSAPAASAETNETPEPEGSSNTPEGSNSAPAPSASGNREEFDDEELEPEGKRDPNDKPDPIKKKH